MPSNSLGSGTSRPEPVMPIVPPTARMARGSIAATAWSTGTMFPMLPRPRGLLIVLTATLEYTTHPLPLSVNSFLLGEVDSPTPARNRAGASACTALTPCKLPPSHKISVWGVKLPHLLPCWTRLHALHRDVVARCADFAPSSKLVQKRLD